MQNSFDFITWISDEVYTAKQTHDGNYKIFLKGSLGNIGPAWSKCDVECRLKSGAWKKIEEKSKNFFSIKQGQIESAARFIVVNNKYMHNHSVDSMSAKIKSYIKEMIDKINSGKESYYCATAGFVITIGLENDNYYVVEVLVSPDVSIDNEFVNVEEII